MKIGNTNYRIVSDKVSIQLLQEYEIKSGINKGEMAYKVVGWYSNMKDLCEGLLRREIKRSELTDLYTIIKRIDEVKDVIQNIDFSEVEFKRQEKQNKSNEGE